jgi:hypothetical protein
MTAPPAPDEALAAALALSPPSLASHLAQLRQDTPDDYRALVRAWTARSYPTLTPLERHIAVFDPDNDGIINLLHTYQACRQMGGGIWLSLKSTVVTLAAISRLKWVPWSMEISRVAELAHPAVHSGGFQPDGSTEQIPTVVDHMLHTEGMGCPLRMGKAGILRFMGAIRDRSEASPRAVKDAARISFLEWPVLLGFTGGQVDAPTLHSLFLGSLFFELLRPEALAERMLQRR